MSNRVIITPDAEADIIEIGDYLADVCQNPAAAEKTVDGIYDALEKLHDFPEMGSLLYLSEHTPSEYRYVRFEQYLAFYRIKNDTVEIDRVLHGARNYLSLLIDRK